jgi:hypothetical protein
MGAQPLAQGRQGLAHPGRQPRRQAHRAQQAQVLHRQPQPEIRAGPVARAGLQQPAQAAVGQAHLRVVQRGQRQLLAGQQGLGVLPQLRRQRAQAAQGARAGPGLGPASGERGMRTAGRACRAS